MRMAQEMMIKQRLGEMPATDKHPRFEVFTTGKLGWYLFCPMIALGISGTLQIPVEGKRLKRGWKRLLI